MPEQPAVSAEGGKEPITEQHVDGQKDKASLSKRDQAVHTAVGEMNFKTLTNTDTMRDPNIGKQLRKDHKLEAGTDATKSCLDRIRRAKDYPLSREIAKKRSTRK